MASGDCVFLTPQKEFVYQDKKFKSLCECYNYELKRNEPIMGNTAWNSWARQKIAEIKRNERNRNGQD